MPTFEHQLEEILSKNPNALVRLQKERLQEKLSKYGEKYILFGAGHLGQLTLARLRTAGVEPVAFADNNSKLWNTSVDGVIVLSALEAVRQYAHDAIFVITVYTSQPVWEQLTAMDVGIISFAELAWLYTEIAPHWAVEHPYKIFEQSSDVRKALTLWADEASRQEYIGQLKWRTLLDRSTLPPHLPQSQIYFATDLVASNTDEVFVDCGAFDGDSLQEFIAQNKSVFKGIIAIEPDPINGKVLEARIATLPVEIQHRIQIIPNATGSKRSKVTFNATGTVGSAIGTGSYQVESVPLDELLASTSPTFIKMDIEGAEPDAIVGASKLISTHAPVLAICLYHAQEHLWQIPLLIQSLRADYHFFLRRYSDECWEIVCYAVPKSRLAV